MKIEDACPKFNNYLHWKIWVQTHGACPKCNTMGTLRYNSGEWFCLSPKCDDIMMSDLIEDKFDCPYEIRTTRPKNQKTIPEPGETMPEEVKIV